MSRLGRIAAESGSFREFAKRQFPRRRRMASYGAIPSVGVDAERIRRPALNRKVLLGVGVTAVLAACTLIVLMASTPSPRDGPVALLSRKATGLALTPTAPTHDVNDPEPADKEVDTSNDEEFSAPYAPLPQMLVDWSPGGPVVSGVGG